MRLTAFALAGSTFIAAAAVAVVTANFAVTKIEETSEIDVRQILDKGEMTWAEVQANGLQVTLTGVAPNEADRFTALTTTGKIVDTARIIDEMQVEALADIAPPKFSAEILRNASGISVIGLIPTDMDHEDIIARFTDMTGPEKVADLIETAAYPAPEGWSTAFEFALRSIGQLPRSKVSISPGQVSITAIADSVDEKVRMEKNLLRNLPSGVNLMMDIAAPRPVITPFTLRFISDEQGARFDACSADTEEAAAAILNAAKTAGYEGQEECTLGMGVPSPNWSKAVTAGIDAVSEMGAGSVTFSNADITLIGPEGLDQKEFDRVAGELDTKLPNAFVLFAKLPEIIDPNKGPPEFRATLSPEGKVEIRGRLTDENLRSIVDSYAKARFGSDQVYIATRLAEELPNTWPTRVLAGLESLYLLANGQVSVTPSSVKISGDTGHLDANRRISSLLATKLGDAQEFKIDVTYQKRLDPIAGLPTPEECAQDVQKIIATHKIIFEPGSATIDASSLETMDKIAAVLKKCDDVALEIQGHTDSQGREEMNLNLSQSRAQSVLNELRARRILTSSYVAKGYGESAPIADNKTAEGREDNRRIEFHLIKSEPLAKNSQTALENTEQSDDTSNSEENMKEGNTDEQN